jgi:hypothetical protein
VALQKCLIEDPSIEWEDVIDWGVKELKGNSLKSTLCMLMLGAVVYHVWWQRNELKHGVGARSEEQINKIIDWEVRSIVIGLGRFTNTKKNQVLCSKWGIHDKFLL